ncbi:DUF3143 domain-containing protein [Lyngbya confervoides]|uniref:DUF3143 domain-containing protein n=1 Tax=Lyngbya confervoides BDU141951 TaxID=1574623 RepID=A0ABD4T0K8_9CYAN|nr:DUF3143 domain-containing protein [Lyngbya confervoides]MCM1982194.1 DUF3143 domain-containing protein [Lyngbya confervoides BDU141951]
MTPTLPSSDTPLYNHPLPAIELWLSDHGCSQDRQLPHLWHLEHPQWRAELNLDIEDLTVVYYLKQDPDHPIKRTFKYSLSRQDLDAAIFMGP